MKRTIEDNVINRMCPEHNPHLTTSKETGYWLTIHGLQTVKAHVALSGMDIVADVTKALVKQYGRKEAIDMVNRLYDESTRQPDVHHYVEALIAAL